MNIHHLRLTRDVPELGAEAGDVLSFDALTGRYYLTRRIQAPPSVVLALPAATRPWCREPDPGN